MQQDNSGLCSAIKLENMAFRGMKIRNERSDWRSSHSNWQFPFNLFGADKLLQVWGLEHWDLRGFWFSSDLCRREAVICSLLDFDTRGEEHWNLRGLKVIRWNGKRNSKFRSSQKQNIKILGRKKKGLNCKPLARRSFIS